MLALHSFINNAVNNMPSLFTLCRSPPGSQSAGMQGSNAATDVPPAASFDEKLFPKNIFNFLLKKAIYHTELLIVFLVSSYSLIAEWLDMISVRL